MWLLWEIEAMVEDIARVEIEKMKSGIVATMAMFLQDKARFRKCIDTKLWRETAGDHAFHGELWLLAYEGSKRGWLPLKMKNLDEFNIASALSKRNVSFLDGDEKIEPIFERVPRIKVGEIEEEEDRLAIEIEGYGYIFSPRYEIYG